MNHGQDAADDELAGELRWIVNVALGAPPVDDLGESVKHLPATTQHLSTGHERLDAQEPRETRLLLDQGQQARQRCADPLAPRSLTVVCLGRDRRGVGERMLARCKEAIIPVREYFVEGL